MKPATTVLLADDELLITEMMADALAESGFAVVVANTGAAALSLVENAPVKVDVLVTDVNMGKGSDGWALARRARDLRPDLPIIYTTGGSAEAWSKNGVPGSVLVVKPFLAASVVEAINSLLGNAIPQT